MAMMKTLLEGDFYAQLRQAMCKEFNDAVVETFKVPSTMQGQENTFRWHVPQGFGKDIVAGVPRNMSVGYRAHVADGPNNPCNEIYFDHVSICSLPYKLEDKDTPEQAYDRAMKGI